MQLALGLVIGLTLGTDAFAAGKKQKNASSPEAVIASSKKADAGDTPAAQTDTKTARKAERLAAKGRSESGPVTAASLDPHPAALRLAACRT